MVFFWIFEAAFLPQILRLLKNKGQSKRKHLEMSNDLFSTYGLRFGGYTKCENKFIYYFYYYFKFMCMQLI